MSKNTQDQIFKDINNNDDPSESNYVINYYNQRKQQQVQQQTVDNANILEIHQNIISRPTRKYKNNTNTNNTNSNNQNETSSSPSKRQLIFSRAFKNVSSQKLFKTKTSGSIAENALEVQQSIKQQSQADECSNDIKYSQGDIATQSSRNVSKQEITNQRLQIDYLQNNPATNIGYLKNKQESSEQLNTNYNQSLDLIQHHLKFNSQPNLESISSSLDTLPQNNQSPKKIPLNILSEQKLEWKRQSLDCLGNKIAKTQQQIQHSTSKLQYSFQKQLNEIAKGNNINSMNQLISHKHSFSQLLPSCSSSLTMEYLPPTSSPQKDKNHIVIKDCTPNEKKIIINRAKTNYLDSQDENDHDFEDKLSEKMKRFQQQILRCGHARSSDLQGDSASNSTAKQKNNNINKAGLFDKNTFNALHAQLFKNYYHRMNNLAMSQNYLRTSEAGSSVSNAAGCLPQQAQLFNNQSCLVQSNIDVRKSILSSSQHWNAAELIPEDQRPKTRQLFTAGVKDRPVCQMQSGIDTGTPAERVSTEQSSGSGHVGVNTSQHILTMRMLNNKSFNTNMQIQRSESLKDQKDKNTEKHLQIQQKRPNNGQKQSPPTLCTLLNLVSSRQQSTPNQRDKRAKVEKNEGNQNNVVTLNNKEVKASSSSSLVSRPKKQEQFQQQQQTQQYQLPNKITSFRLLSQSRATSNYALVFKKGNNKYVNQIKDGNFVEIKFNNQF